MNKSQLEPYAVGPASERFRSWAFIPLGILLLAVSACGGESVESTDDDGAGSGGKETSSTGGASSGGAGLGGAATGGAATGGAATATGGATTGGAGMGGAGSSTEECDAGTFDDDDDAMTACVAWQSCEPGTFVSEEGGATSDRVCTPCFEGTYTDQQNQAECLVSEECPDGSWVAEPSL